ncbi:MAG: hypothetical protein K2O24_02970 [Muribaculaceae bacterium]|nr:hypothetical protein [Muribaculaceae bacterium]
MRHPLLAALVVAAMPMAALAQHSPVPDFEIFSLPDGISSVEPAQGYVDISANMNPLGLREISVTFRSTPAINRDCKEMAVCRYNGVEAAAVTNASSYVDAMGNPTAGINFGKNLTSPGFYNVTIPQGFWIANGVPSPAIELNYEIFDLFRISPAAGLHDSLSEIVLDFPKADEVKLNKRSNVEFYRTSPEEIYSLRFETVANPTDGRLNRVVMTILDADGSRAVGDLTVPGTYAFHCISDAFSAYVYGPNHSTDPTDYVEWLTPEILRTYEIAACPAPAIEPAQGTLEKFTSFTLTVPSVFNLMMVDDRNNKSGIYAIEADGSVALDPICLLKAQRDFDVPGVFTLSVADNRGVIIPEGITPVNGDYMMILAPGLYSGFFNNDFINSSPYQYRYTIYNESVNVEGLEASEENVTVYNLAGVRLLDNAEPAALHTLPAGLYIVNGRKLVIR